MDDPVQRQIADEQSGALVEAASTPAASATPERPLSRESRGSPQLRIDDRPLFPEDEIDEDQGAWTDEIPDNPDLEEPDEETPIERLRRCEDFVLAADLEELEGVRNHQFAQWLEEDRRHSINCKTLPLTICTWIAFLFVAWTHGNIDDTFRMQQCLKGAINEVKAKHSVSGIGKDINSIVQLSTVNSVDEMWSWIEGGLVPAMAGPPQKPAFVRTFNQVVGQIQLRETRFTTDDCKVGKELTAYYRQGCHSESAISNEAYGPGLIPGNNTDKAFLPGYGMPGKLSEENAMRFFSWLDIRRPVVGQAAANALRSSKWVDDGTKSLEVTIVFFNAEIQAYAHVSVMLHLMRGGLIKVEMEVRSLWATMYTEWYHYFADIFWLMCVLKFILNSLQKVVDNKEARNCLVRCCTLPKPAGGGYWLALDWAGIVLAIALMSFLPIFLGGFSSLATKLGGLGIGGEPLLGNETVAQITNWQSEYDNFYAMNAEIIDEVENLIMLKTYHRLGMFWYCMVFLMRWFIGFRGQARISQITSTLHSALADLLHYAIIFSVLFVNFAIAGHVLFGSEVTEWSTVTKALQSSLAMAWGRMEFNPLHEVAPFASLIWLLGYVIGMVMLSMNMLLAIISDHFGGVFHANNAGDKGYDIFGQIVAMVYEGWWNFSYVARWLYRISFTMFPKRVKANRFVPKLQPEEVRLEIPYEEIYWACEMDPLGFTTEQFLRRAGCDKCTAAHILKKCEDEVLRHLDEFYPLELLFDEFDESMKQYYNAMDHFSNELRSWFADKSSHAAKMIPRQTRLDDLSRSIETAQHIEHKHHHHHSAATMEGPGHHHHHHRRHGPDDETGSHSQSGVHSGTHSQSQSMAQSLQVSRSPSKGF